jgi:hypothetical protein
MDDPHAELGRQPRGDEGPVAGFRIALDAEERRRRIERKGREVCAVEDLALVALSVRVGEPGARSLADAEPVVLPVLEPA